jgi:hypothetical protein
MYLNSNLIELFLGYIKHYFNKNEKIKNSQTFKISNYITFIKSSLNNL